MLTTILWSLLLLTTSSYAQKDQQKQVNESDSVQQQSQQQNTISASTQKNPTFNLGFTTRKEDKNTQSNGDLFSLDPVNAQILDNPTYDPNIYNSFLPQDDVYKYVAQYNSHNSPYQLTEGIAVSQPLVPVLGTQMIPAQYAPGYPHPQPIGIQTGYEGYLIPEYMQPEEEVEDDDVFGIFRSINNIATYSRSFISWLSKAGSYFVSLITVILFGGAVTTAVCTLTPLCSISFAVLPFLRFSDTAESIGKTLSNELTPERVRRAARFLEMAIEKYQTLQAVSKANDKANIQKVTPKDKN